MDQCPKTSQDDADPDPDPDPITTRSDTITFPNLEKQPHGYPQGASPASGTSEQAVALKKEKGRVRFNSSATQTTTPPIHKPGHARHHSAGHNTGHHHAEQPTPRPRPPVLRNGSSGSVPTLGNLADNRDDQPSPDKANSAAAAQERANQVAARVRGDSPKPAPGSRDSFESEAETVSSGSWVSGDHMIPLRNLNGTGDDGDDAVPDETEENKRLREEAQRLVRSHTQAYSKQPAQNNDAVQQPQQAEGPTWNEINYGFSDGVYDVPAPETYRPSILSQLLKLYKAPEMGHHRNVSSTSISSAGPSTGPATPGFESGAATPKKKWYEQNRSQETLANLVGASTRLANPNEPERKGHTAKKKKPGHRRTGSASRLSTFLQQNEARITVHIAETLSRQEYIIDLCRALMLYGAPTHRLEEYLSMTARVLEIDGQFLYLPGCMIISFDDRSTHTTEVRIVRSLQGINLGKLKEVHRIYKEVMHDVIGVEEGSRRLDQLMKAKDKFPAWARVIVFGLTSATAAPFSFGARLIDLPMCFCFGALVGLLQLIVAPKSNLYSNVFEVTATIIVSFLARAFGSIYSGGDRLFCFSALAQGGIVMLLPGYSVLCSSLELQSRAMVPGAIRIVYAIIYSLLLGFGITVGATLWGTLDSDPPSRTTCSNSIHPYYSFIFVPFFNICICMLYQAKWRQMPAMIVIAFAGYIVNYFSSQRFVASPAIANTLGALAVGILANFYSRIRHGVAAATLIPAIFTQVPGGLASTGGLLSGLTTANMITNATEAVNGTNSVQVQPGEGTNGVIFNVAGSMIQIAIGIAVGLFLSALLVYPLGKRRSGLFSF